MTELTDLQVWSLGAVGAGPVRLVNPRTREVFVLVPATDYERLVDKADASGRWTREELAAAAWEVGRAGWDGMDEYDDIPDKS